MRGAPSRRRLAFSLIELLIVVAILAVLVGFAQPYFQQHIQEANRAKVRTDLENIVAAIQRYQVQRGMILTGGTLQPLVGATLQELPRDPWGSEYFFDGSLAVVGSAAGQELGIESRPLVLQYVTYLAPTQARFQVGTFGTQKKDYHLVIRLSKPYQVGAGQEAVVPYDIEFLLSSEVPFPVPAALYGYEYAPTLSNPSLGLLALKITTPNASAPPLPAESKVLFAAMTSAIRETTDPESSSQLIDPLPYLWGTEPQQLGEQAWAGAIIRAK